MVPRYSKRQLLVAAQMPGLVMCLVSLIDHRLWSVGLVGLLLSVSANLILSKYDRRWAEERAWTLLPKAEQAVEAAAGL